MYLFSSNYEIKGNTLIVKNIEKAQFGYFQAFASNGFHEISSTAFLNVKGKQNTKFHKLYADDFDSTMPSTHTTLF